MPTVAELLQESQSLLKERSDTARLDAEVLLCEAAKISKLELITKSSRELEPNTIFLFNEMLKRRSSGEPVAYIIGRKEFFGLEFEVGSNVLIPRPDTETLVEAALEFIEKKDGMLNILDLGTGSGCIAISVAAAVKRDGYDFKIAATDRSPKALEIAKTNSARYGLLDVIDFRKADWLSALTQGEKFDIILSNPPYVEEGDRRSSKEIAFEPKRALFSADNGLADILQLLSGVPEYLNEEGVFLCEIGIDHAQMLRDKFGGQNNPSISGFKEVSFIKDLAEIERVLVCIK